MDHMIQFITGTIKVAVIIVAVCMIPAVYRFIRFIIKRIALGIKLKRWCEKNGDTLVPAHFMWIFGTKRGSGFDCYVDSCDAVYAIKLWNTRGKTEEVIFMPDGKWLSRIYTRPVGRGLNVLWFWRDTKERMLPEYDVTYQSRKPIIPILLVNPVPWEIHCDDSPMSHLPGSFGQFDGMHVYSLYNFITGGALETV